MSLWFEIATFGFMISVVIWIGYTSYKDQSGATQRFKLQMEMTKAQSSMTNPLKFEDCRSIINSIVNFYCIMEDVTHGYYKKSPEEVSLEMDKIIIHIALESRTSLGDELVRQFGKFVTIDGDDNYLDRYILHTTKIALVDEINLRRKSTGSTEPMVPKSNPKDHKK